MTGMFHGEFPLAKCKIYIWNRYLKPQIANSLVLLVSPNMEAIDSPADSLNQHIIYDSNICDDFNSLFIPSSSIYHNRNI